MDRMGQGSFSPRVALTPWRQLPVIEGFKETPSREAGVMAVAPEALRPVTSCSWGTVARPVQGVGRRTGHGTRGLRTVSGVLVSGLSGLS